MPVVHRVRIIREIGWPRFGHKRPEAEEEGRDMPGHVASIYHRRPRGIARRFRRGGLDDGIFSITCILAGSFDDFSLRE
jgi:hypothetical protein